MHDDVARIIQETRDSFLDYVEKRRPRFPTVLERMGSDPLRASLWLRPAAYLSFKGLRVRDKRYLVHSDRFPDLLRALPRRQTAVVGTGRDYLQAWALGLPVCSSLDLFLASHAILFGRRGVPVDRILRRWLAFFAAQADPCYLVQPHDTSPISLLLTRIAARVPTMRSVCVQHGLFNAGWDLDDIEGRNSDVSLVYDSHQRDEFQRRRPGPIVEEMGFPADCPGAPDGATTRAVLVGTGDTNLPSRLALSLDVFTRVAHALEPFGLRVEYRPHPAEFRTGHRAGAGFRLNREDKTALLSSQRTLFVGFNSTLLYEAFLAGHEVLILDHPDLPGYAISEFGTRIEFAEIDRLPGRIRDMLERHESPRPSQAPLGARFLDALERAEARRAAQAHGQSAANSTVPE